MPRSVLSGLTEDAIPCKRLKEWWEQRDLNLLREACLSILPDFTSNLTEQIRLSVV
jgi:hypothetical protein